MTLVLHLAVILACRYDALLYNHYRCFLKYDSFLSSSLIYRPKYNFQLDHLRQSAI